MHGDTIFARVVSIKVKRNCAAELNRIIEQDVIPLFRLEKDFLGLLTFISRDGTDALSLSLWDHEKNAEANCPAELSTLTALAGVIQGTPSVQVYTVSNSTLRFMETMLRQEDGIEATHDLRVYQDCAPAFPLVARTVHAELRFPAFFELQEFGAQ